MNKQSKKPSSHSTEAINLDFVNPQYPIDSTAERALVAALVDSPNQLPEAWLQLGGADSLGNEAYRIILTALHDLYSENKPIKLSSIIQRLNKSGEIKTLLERGVNLIDLQREAFSADCIETCLYLRGLAVKRRAVDASNEIRCAVAANESVDQIADKVSRFYEGLTSGLSVGQEKTHSDFMSEALRRLDLSMQNPGSLTGVNMGIGKLNKHLGGWQDSDVIMVAGRPGMGKSVMGVFFALSAAEAGVPVAFLSLEMPARSLINRAISNKTGIPYGDIMKGRIDQDQAKRIHVAAGEIEKLPIHWYDEAERDISDLSYLLLNWKRKHKIGLVIIDYVQLCEDRTVRTTDEYQVLTSVSKKLKKLQRRLNCPVIELAQLSRGVESRTNRRGKQSDLKSTGQFEQDASVIVMLFREDYYAEEDAIERAKETGSYVKPTLNHKLEAGVVKNRDGYTGTIMLHCDVSVNQVFSDRPPHEQPVRRFPDIGTDSWPLEIDKTDF